MESTSPTLLERVRSQNDSSAWDRFVKLYTPFVFHCCLKLGLRDDEAADAVQDVFVLLLKKLRDFKHSPEGSFRGWLRTVTENKCYERYRRRTELAKGGSGIGLSQIEDNRSSGQWWDEEYNRHLVARAIEIMQVDFEPATWKACWLTIVEGRSVMEVAEELQITINAVYVARSRVLRRLREELQGLLDT